MTEPVAYLYTTDKNKKEIYLEFCISDNKNFNSIPLYTKEQLHPRVKMTKRQHEQFENYKVNKNNFYHFWQSLLVDDVSLFKEFSERELMLVWLDDETIEIVPDMKWFVRSKGIKKSDDDGDEFYAWLIDISELYPSYVFSDWNASAIQFDTKEEAEKWTNPLTEAVQLPVEEE